MNTNINYNKVSIDKIAFIASLTGGKPKNLVLISEKEGDITNYVIQNSVTKEIFFINADHSGVIVCKHKGVMGSDAGDDVIFHGSYSDIEDDFELSEHVKYTPVETYSDIRRHYFNI